MLRSRWNIVMSARNLFTTPLAEEVSTKPTKLAVEFLEPRAMLSRDSGVNVRLSDYASNCDTVYTCPTGPVCDTSQYTRECTPDSSVPTCPPKDNCEYDTEVSCTPTSTPTPCPSASACPEPYSEAPNCEIKPRDCEETPENGCVKERNTDCQPKNCDTQPKCNSTATPSPCPPKNCETAPKCDSTPASAPCQPGSDAWRKAVGECQTYGTVKCETKTPSCEPNGAKKNGSGNNCEVQQSSSNKRGRYEKSNEDRCERPSKSNSNCDPVKVSSRAVDQCFGDSRAVSKINAARFR